MLSAGFSSPVILFGTPLFFGLAHVHHGVSRWQSAPRELQNIVLSTMFQVLYTMLFGALMMDVLVKTENVVTAMLIHSFCNLNGFPNFVFWKNENIPILQRVLVGALYVGGIVLFWNFHWVYDPEAVYFNYL
jgi:prenyl protein peptidase